MGTKELKIDTIFQSSFRGFGLEICVDNIEGAIAAEKAGADRIELCSNLIEGGITPSFAYIEYAIQNLSIPIFPIIRPRGGDFFYSNAEFEIMQKDVAHCKLLGCKGIVVGILKANGDMDMRRTKILVDIAEGMEVTFHRAFDRTNFMQQALEDVIATGCKRILTSGLYENVNDGIRNLKELVEAAKDRIIIMPGSGVKSNNLQHLINTTKAKEYHSSARKSIVSQMEYFNPNFNKEENKYIGVDVEEIKLMKNVISQFDNYSI